MAKQEAHASLSSVRVSPRKLGLVAGLIRSRPVADALLQLRFCKRRISRDVYKCLQSAIANAEHNNNMDVDRLWVNEVMVGKSFSMKRMRCRARGRGARIVKFFSRLTITLKEL